MISVSASEALDLARLHIRVIEPSHRLTLSCAFLHLAVCALMASLTDTWLLWAVVGIPAFVVPVLMVHLYPHDMLARLSVAAGFMTFTALIIQQSGGDMEAHFSFFLLMSVQVVYADWRPLILSFVLIIIHHVVFTLLQPIGVGFYVWNDSRDAWGHVAVHGTVGAMQTVALCFLAGLLRDRDALARENQVLGRSLEHAHVKANKDALTGLYNRSFLAKLVDSLSPIVVCGQERVTLCIFDVDHFKAVNDSYGHASGDDVLRVLAKLAVGQLRDTDCIVRYGGEEFLAILRNCSVKDGAIIAEALRREVEKVPLITQAGAIEITISIGVSEWTQKDSFQKAFNRADQAVYVAKRNGRNRVEIAIPAADGGSVHEKAPQLAHRGAQVWWE